MRTGILIVVLVAMNLIVKAQQDPQFSQNMFNHVTVNPAFVGQQNRWVVSGIYRSQWQKMEGAPETYAVNVDAPLRLGRTDGGIGLNVMNDRLGMQRMLHVMLNYSYKRTLRLGVLSAGVKFGVINSKIEGDYYNPEGDDYTRPEDDPALNGSRADLSKMLFDAGLGVFLTGDRFYAGMAVSHLTRPEMTVGLTGKFFLTPHLCFSGGYALPLSPKCSLQPSVFVQTDFAGTQYSVNANAVFNQMYWGGVSYRYGEAVVFLAGMELKNGILVGYSYDWNVAGIGKYVGGTHEVTLSYSFGLRFGKRQKMYKSVRFL